MKTFEAIGSIFCVSPVLKKLACRGSSNSETVCFKLNRYAGKTDLSECNCTVKTKNSEGTSDLNIPEVTSDDKKLNVYWTLSSGATAAAGPILVQIQFEKLFDDESKNINWQSNIMEFEISDSLDAADEIDDQDPTIFQQWEEKVNTLYADAAADVQAVQALQTQVQTNADAVAQQKQSVEQTAGQVMQKAQDAAASASAAQTSAEQAQASAADAQTAQGLAKGYSDAAKTYSDSAAVSAQDAQTSAQTVQQQADAAQQAATEAQQKVNDFSGYSREEIDNGFACALIGEASGQSVTLDDVQPNTSFRSLFVTGQTLQEGSGDPSPENARPLHGVTSLTISDGVTPQILALPQPLYRLPDGEADGYDAVSGMETQAAKSIILSGSENWSWVDNSPNSSTIVRYSLGNIAAAPSHDSIPHLYCDRFKNIYDNTVENIRIHGSQDQINIFILKSRIAGWSDSWTADQKISAFKTWLAANPVTVVYRLKAPVSLQFTPAAIKPLRPCTLSAGGGALTVQYVQDSNLILGKLETAIAGLGGVL